MEENSTAEFDTAQIIALLVRDNYLSPMEGEVLKRQNNSINTRPIPVEALKENLKISLSSGKLTPRNIRDFRALLIAIEKVKEGNILSIDFISKNKNRTVYIDQLLTTTFDEL